MVSEEFAGWSDPDAQARGWIARLKSGEATQHDLDMLADWRSESEEHEQSFTRAVHLWNELGPALAGGGGLPVRGAMQSTGPVSRRWVLGGAGGLAATAATVLFVGGTSAPAGAKVFETRKGERQRLQLEKQVSVDLNTDSRLFYWADSLLPRVTLDRGEAIVTAQCDGDRYLQAMIHEKQIVAQNARFLLRRDDDVAKIACLDGTLTIRSAGKDYPMTSGTEVDFRGDVVQPAKTAPSTGDLGWQRDLLQFKNRPVVEVIDELNRYRPGRVYLRGDRSNVRISGVIHLKRADLAVDHIARSLGMKVTRLPGGIAILRDS